MSEKLIEKESNKKYSTDKIDDISFEKNEALAKALETNTKNKNDLESSDTLSAQEVVDKLDKELNKIQKAKPDDGEAEIESSIKSHKSNKIKKKKGDPGYNKSVFVGLFVAFGIIAVSFTLALGGLSLGKEYLGIDKEENDVTFNIPQGASGDDVADILVENGIIEHKQFFRLFYKMKNPQIYSGNITLQPKSGYSEIISQLVIMRETKKTVTITFPEGTTLYSAANTLEKKGVCKADDFLFEFNKNQGFEFENLIDGNENAFYAMEGYCFPDQYEFYQEDTGYNIAKIIKENFQKKFTSSMLNTMKKNNLTLNQLITLASIVQWESESVEQMPTVASVFINRLNNPETFPALQSDATSNYIKKVIDKAADTTAATEHYTESYDTYNYKGLPAGPICNPGVEAINAVLNPNKTDYYYFCNNLKTKKTYYAKTLEEHEKNLVKAGLK